MWWFLWRRCTMDMWSRQRKGTIHWTCTYLKWRTHACHAKNLKVRNLTQNLNNWNLRYKAILHLPNTEIVNSYHVHSIFNALYRCFLNKLCCLLIVRCTVFGFTINRTFLRYLTFKRNQNIIYPKNVEAVLSPVGLLKALLVCLVPIRSSTKTSTNELLVKLIPWLFMFAYRL